MNLTPIIESRLEELYTEYLYPNYRYIVYPNDSNDYEESEDMPLFHNNNSVYSCQIDKIKTLSIFNPNDPNPIDILIQPSTDKLNNPVLTSYNETNLYFICDNLYMSVISQGFNQKSCLVHIDYTNSPYLVHLEELSKDKNNKFEKDLYLSIIPNRVTDICSFIISYNIVNKDALDFHFIGGSIKRDDIIETTVCYGSPIISYDGRIYHSDDNYKFIVYETYEESIRTKEKRLTTKTVYITNNAIYNNYMKMNN